MPQTMSDDSPQAKASIEVLEGDHKSLRLALSDRPSYSIGRGEGCDLLIKDRSVSRVHSRIEYDGDYFWLVDCGSANGTLVNQARVSRYMLYDGDVIRTGKVSMVFRCASHGDA